MSYWRWFRKLFGWFKNQRLLTFVCCLLLLVLALPVFGWIMNPEGKTTIGIPSVFFIMTLVSPLIAMFVLTFFIRISEDNDRHNPEFENE